MLQSFVVGCYPMNIKDVSGLCYLWVICPTYPEGGDNWLQNLCQPVVVVLPVSNVNSIGKDSCHAWHPPSVLGVRCFLNLEGNSAELA